MKQIKGISQKGSNLILEAKRMSPSTSEKEVVKLLEFKVNGLGYFIKILKPKAPCAPITNDCSISAVLEGPDKNNP